MVGYMSPAQPQPSDEELEAWIVDANEELARGPDESRRTQLQRLTETWCHELLFRQACELLERRGWIPEQLSDWDAEARLYVDAEYLPYNSKPAWRRALRRRTISVLQKLIAQVSWKLEQTTTEIPVAAEQPVPAAAQKKHGGGAKKRENDPLWMMLATEIAAHEDSMDKSPGLEQLWNWARQLYANDPVAFARIPENPAEVGRMLRHYRKLPGRRQLQREEA